MANGIMYFLILFVVNCKDRAGCYYQYDSKKKSGTAVCACLAVCRRRDSCIGLFSADPDMACP